MRSTKAGWLQGKEVVDLEYDPAVTTFTRLLAHAQEKSCAMQVWVTTAAQRDACRRRDVECADAVAVRADQEPKYRLLQTPWRHVPMTPLQATRANALITRGDDAAVRALLSPRQLALRARIDDDGRSGWPVVVDVPIAAAWSRVQAFDEKAR